jgi:hypothetical protein
MDMEMTPIVWRMIPNATQFQPARRGVSSCCTRILRVIHGRDARATLIHDKCLTFLAANGRSFLAPENHAVLFFTRSALGAAASRLP